MKSHLLNALAENKFPRECVLWINSFLSDRYFRVSCNGDLSDWLPVLSGVPQGSKLGPVLFALLVSSIKPTQSFSSHVKFADDLSNLNLFRSITDDGATQKELRAIELWSTSHGMTINASKTKFLCISSDKTHKCSILLDASGAMIERVDSASILGITLTSKLSWDEHVDIVTKKSSRRFFALLQMKRAGMPPHILWNAYTALIRSCNTYAFACMCNMSVSNFGKLEKVERRVAKLIGEPPKELQRAFCEASCRRLITDMLTYESHPLRELFDWTPRRQTRHSTVPRRPFARLNRYKNSIISFLC